MDDPLTPILIAAAPDRPWRQEALERAVDALYGPMGRVEEELRDGERYLRVRLDPTVSYDFGAFWSEYVRHERALRVEYGLPRSSRRLRG